MALNDRGYLGEWLGQQYIHSNGGKCFQPDWIAYDAATCEYYAVEVKHKRAFNTISNGFAYSGWGLPLWQVTARMNYMRNGGHKYKLIIIDPDSHVVISKFQHSVDVYTAWLQELESTHSYIDIKTKSGEQDRIYDKRCFNKETLQYNPTRYNGRIPIA